MFQLADVRWPPKAGSEKAGPGQTRRASAEKETLRLAGLEKRLKVEEHVGHTVTVSGTLAREDRIVTPGVVLPDPPPGTAKPEVGGKASMRILNVASISRVAEGCK
jgi:hypothetical protein